MFLQPSSTCSETAPELFASGRSFVCLSIAAWIMILLGYLVPFCFLAVILSHSGGRNSSTGVAGLVAPGAGMNGDWRNVWNNVPGRNLGAPSECMDLLDIILLHDFPEEYPKDCCVRTLAAFFLSMMGDVLCNSFILLFGYGRTTLIKPYNTDMYERLCSTGCYRIYTMSSRVS